MGCDSQSLARLYVLTGTDWWTKYYPEDNMKRPTGPTCDGCHSVNYDVSTKKVTEWNVGCEKCHGPGRDHIMQPSQANIVNPARLNYVDATNTCIQCHSQGRPLTTPTAGKAFDWPVGFDLGKRLEDFWKLEEHKLGETTFTHFADGTAHKNRMQGNDFVTSSMYTHGVACFSCHDVHGTDNNALLLKPANVLCLDCHGVNSPNGPHALTIEQHTHHKVGSQGNECITCHMPNPTDDRGRERAQPHLSLRHSSNDRRIENSECLQRLPRRQINGMGHGCRKDMGGPVTLALAQ